VSSKIALCFLNTEGKLYINKLLNHLIVHISVHLTVFLILEVMIVRSEPTTVIQYSSTYIYLIIFVFNGNLCYTIL